MVAMSEDPVWEEEDQDTRSVSALAILSCKGSVMPKVLIHLILVTIIAIVFTILYQPGHLLHGKEFDIAAHLFLGVALTFMVTFEMVIAYHRYYEGAAQVHVFLKGCRTVAMLCSFVDEKLTVQAGAEQEKMGISKFRDETARLLRVAFDTFSQSLEGKNKKYEPTVETKPGENVDLTMENGTMMAIKYIATLLQKQRVAGRVSGEMAAQISGELSQMSLAYHNAMRVRFTPFPFPIKQLSKLIMVIWCYTVPIAIASNTHEVFFWAPLSSFCLVLFFFGASQIGSELENPFGHDSGDLDMEGFAAQLAKDVAQLMSK